MHTARPSLKVMFRGSTDPVLLRLTVTWTTNYSVYSGLLLGIVAEAIAIYLFTEIHVNQHNQKEPLWFSVFVLPDNLRPAGQLRFL